MKKALYIAISIHLDGTKEEMGMYIGGNESAKYWLGVPNNLKARGVQRTYSYAVLTGSRLMRCHFHSLFPDRYPEVHNTPDTLFNMLCHLKGHEGFRL